MKASAIFVGTVLFIMSQLVSATQIGVGKPEMKGNHEFAVVNSNSSIFLSHLPNYHKHGRAQIVYEMEVLPTHMAFSQLVKTESIVTFRATEAFDLQRLIAGMPLKVSGDVYAGRYGNGGWAVYKDFEIHFETQKYVRKFDDKEQALKPASNFQTYDIIPLARGHRLWIHRVQQKPSYDHLLLTIDNIACPTQITTTSSVPDEAEIYRRLTSCGSLKPLYFSSYNLK